MEYRRLGNAGLQLSAIGLGTNNFGMRIDEAQAALVVHQALDAGVNHFDTAYSYGGGKSEEFLGKALKGKRQQAVVATKFANATAPGPNNHSPSRRLMIEQLETSLRRLQTDYVDLYWVHYPDPDYSTPVEETLRGLDDLVRAGKVRYIGCSNFDTWRACEAEWTARAHNLNRFTAVQNNYNLLNRDAERDLAPFCQAYGVGLVPYFPLASGFLTGKYHKGEAPPPDTRGEKMPRLLQGYTSDENWARLEGLQRFAQERGRSVGELAHAWLLAQPAVCSVITGATRPEQVAENVKGVDWKLSADDLKKIDEVCPA